MGRRAVPLAAVGMLLAGFLLHVKLSQGSNRRTREWMENTDSRVTMRPFYSLNGYNPMIRATQPSGPWALLRRVFAPSQKLSHSLPKVEYMKFAGVAVAYRAHPDARGVVLLLHGCGEYAGTWYELPEHHKISIAHFGQGFSTLAVSSANRQTQCWNTRFPAGENDDVARVLQAVSEYYKRFNHDENFPLHGLGASSGGSFLSVFSTTGRVKSQALYITPGNRKAFRHSRPGYPKTLFVHALHDALSTAQSVETSKQVLVRRGVNVGILPQPIPKRSPEIFSQNIPGITRAHAAKLATAADEVSFLRTLQDFPTAIHPQIYQTHRVLSGAHAVSSIGAEDIAAWL